MQVLDETLLSSAVVAGVRYYSDGTTVFQAQPNGQLLALGPVTEASNDVQAAFVAPLAGWLVGALRAVLGLAVTAAPADEGFLLRVPGLGELYFHPEQTPATSLIPGLTVEGWVISYSVGIAATRDTPPDEDLVESGILVGSDAVTEAVLKLVVEQRYARWADSQAVE